MKMELVAILFASSTLSLACNTAPKNEGAAPKVTAEVEKAVPELPVAAVAELVKTKNGVVVDANDAKTREEYGTVPGALLLSNHKTFALSELPANKSETLVFYCGGVKCRASDSAATRAASAGYRNVSVMREGIRGWKSAGQPTEQPRS